MEYPEITILVPTYDRHKFLPLFVMNLKSQTYPADRLKLIIADDFEYGRFITDIDEFKREIHPIELTYLQTNKRLSIGEKRNNLVKHCSTNIFCFMDDDDVYFPSYIQHSYETLRDNNLLKCGCVGSDKMIFCMSEKDYAVHAIDCGNTKRLIHEATMMMTKKFYRASCKFESSSRGEGADLFTGMESRVALTNINDVMMCVQHGENTVDKLQFARDDNRLNIEISDEMREILENIFKK